MLKKMEEYNNNLNNETQGAENNIYTYPPYNPPAKKKKNPLGKFCLCLLLIAGISGGSIGAYKLFTEQDHFKEGKNSIITETSDSKEPKSTTPLLVASKSPADNSLSRTEIVQKLLPSTVGIESVFSSNSSKSNSHYNRNSYIDIPQAYSPFDFFDPFGNDDFDDWFGGHGDFGDKDVSEMTGTGTGVVYTSDGYIITNAHVIYDSEYNLGAAKEVSVLMNDEDDTSYDAKIIAYDIDADLAVLKIDAEDLTPAEFGDSDEVLIGEDAIAIGNPLGLDLYNTVTCGIISGLNRKIVISDVEMTLIQTDAAINSGNSGGPLINAYGQVIGINSAKMSSSYGSGASIEGIGFAIPSNYVTKIVNDLINNGYVTGKVQIGISCQDVSESFANNYHLPLGVYVVGVTENSPAERAGIKQGDIITAVNGEDITSYSELKTIKDEFEVGDILTLTIFRSGESFDLDIKLQEIIPE